MSHPDELVRCSALSNLGEVCKNLKFSLGGIVQELFVCLHNVVEFDKSMSVRRAAVLVVKLLLEGLRYDLQGAPSGCTLPLVDKNISSVTV